MAPDKSETRPSHGKGGDGRERRDDRRGRGPRGNGGPRRDAGRPQRGRGPGPRGPGRDGGDRGRPSGGRPREARRDGGRTARAAPDRAVGRDAPESGAAVQRGDAAEEQTLTIPSTPQKILFKGVDLEVNGRRDLAMVMYLHGAAKLSHGCESNMERLLREAGQDQFPTVRGRVAKRCGEDQMLAFDYICCTLSPGYDRTFLRGAAEAGNPFAIHCLIRLEELDGDDPLIDVYAASGADEAMLRDGLKLLVRKKDSAAAQTHLDEMDRLSRLRQTVRTEFVRAMKGDAQAAERLESLSGTFPEAGFLRGYIDAGDREAYIRDGMDSFRPTVLSVVSELGLSDTPYGRYLSAKRAQSEGGDWVQEMINAAVAGSEDAVAELMPLKNRKDVRKAMSSAYLSRGDAEGLVRSYDGEDTTYLDRYASSDPARMVEVGRLMGGSRQIEWLRHCAIGGSPECRDELVSLASDGDRRGKQLIYALHDVGADLDAARLYFDMYGDPALPAVKWLRKVCEDEAARDYVRSKFEEMGDTATFESIFVDDGYGRRDGRRPAGGGRGRRGPGSGGARGRDHRV